LYPRPPPSVSTSPRGSPRSATARSGDPTDPRTLGDGDVDLERNYDIKRERLQLAGLEFWCALRPAREGGSGVIANAQRHPIGLQLCAADRAREIAFDW
jgi:hypothetical protein